MPQAAVQIVGADYIAWYSYRVTYPGHRATGPTYACGGEPAAPMEFEIELDGLSRCEGDSVFLDVPDWLKGVIEDDLIERDDVYDAIADVEAERAYGD